MQSANLNQVLFNDHSDSEFTCVDLSEVLYSDDALLYMIMVHSCLSEKYRMGAPQWKTAIAGLDKGTCSTLFCTE